MDPPTLSGKPTSFWDGMQKDIQTTVDKNLALLYFRAYGSAHGVFPGHWNPVQWTLEDFVYFYDCPETESAWFAYVDDYLSNATEDTSPSWVYVVDIMNEILNHPEDLINYLNIRPAYQIDKSHWSHADHIAAFIFRLLHYRSHIEEGTPATRDDFQTRQAAYAQSFGKDNPFYAKWEASDRWTAAFLLFCKLSFERDAYRRAQLAEALRANDIKGPELSEPLYPEQETPEYSQCALPQCSLPQPEPVKIGGDGTREQMDELPGIFGVEDTKAYSECMWQSAQTPQASGLLDEVD